MRLFDKIMKKIIPVDEKEEIKFYIPKKETLTKIQQGQCLDKTEVLDYVSYIMANYYLDSEDNIYLLENFMVNWVKNIKTEQDLKTYTNDAYKSILSCLERGIKVSIEDALLVSNRVYVDDNRAEGKRIITKQIFKGNPRLNVQSAYLNPEVEYEVDKLRLELIYKMFKESVDNKL